MVDSQDIAFCIMTDSLDMEELGFKDENMWLDHDWKGIYLMHQDVVVRAFHILDESDNMKCFFEDFSFKVSPPEVNELREWWTTQETIRWSDWSDL
jgi:hypothetical protein